MHVVVDDRERNSGIVRELEKRKDASYCFERLTAGDYKVDGAILFERKTGRDFRQSLVDGRLFSQAKRLADDPLPALLLLEHTKQSDRPRVAVEALEGALVTLPLIFGVPVLRSNGAAQSVRLMRCASRQLARYAAGAVSRPGYRPKGLRKRRLYVLQGLPGVGPRRAESLLNALGSVEAVFSADVKTLAAVPHMGKETARAIRRVVAG